MSFSLSLICGEVLHIYVCVCVCVQMLKHQDDWAGLALVFCGVCVGSHSPTELLRFCCCVTMALLKEPKDKLVLPYELFAESGTHILNFIDFKTLVLLSNLYVHFESLGLVKSYDFIEQHC